MTATLQKKAFEHLHMEITVKGAGGAWILVQSKLENHCEEINGTSSSRKQRHTYSLIVRQVKR